MADTINDNTESQTIRTLAFEYAKAPNYQCLVCKKSILSRSLCIATIERTSKKQKKKLVKPTDTTHFKCWTVPEEFRTQPKPLEVFRGFAGLKPSDKKRIERMKEAGAGTTWAALMEADAAEAAAQQEEGEEDNDDDEVKKPAKPTKRKRTDDTEDKDMTQALTGAHAAGKKKVKAAPAKKETTKEQPKKKKAPKQLDAIHGEGFEDDFNKILDDFK